VIRESLPAPREAREPAMKIAIFGSYGRFYDASIEKRDEFTAFCRRLGETFATFRHTVLRVASDKRITADRWIVEGFAGALQQPYAPRVEIYPRKDKHPFKALEGEKPGLFVRPPLREARKAVAAHLRMLQGADAAVLIGGAEGTYNAGLAAVLTRARIWPIGHFGGAAREFILDVAAIRGSAVRMPDAAFAARLNTASTALDAIRDDAAEYPRIMIVHGRGTDTGVVEAILKKLGVEKVDVLVNESAAGATIVTEFERYASRSDAAIALLTPDDLIVDTIAPDGKAIPADALGAPSLRARQNVLLEYGWFWSRLGRGRTLLLVKDKVEIPSDLYGVKVIPYGDRMDTAEPEIAKFVSRIRSGELDR
jgi:predicted nucleotide-binding protein